MNGHITEKELIEKLKVSRSTIVRWRKKGLPFKKINKLIRYDESEVKKWINDLQEEKEMS